MRVGLVTQWFPPESPSLASSTMARALADRGHQVDVITGFPNYPHGALYPGYSLRPYMRESIDGITVHRGPLYPSHDDNPIRRMANYLSFSLGAVPTSYRIPEPDVWLTNSTPVTVSLPSVLHRATRKTPHAQIIQDLWPDSLVGTGIVGDKPARLMSAVLTPACTMSYALTDSIGVISPGMADLLASRGVARSKLEFIPNGIDAAHLCPSLEPSAELKAELGLPAGRIFMYAGNLGRLQNLHNLIAAFARVPEAYLVLVGSGIEERALQSAASGVPNVRMIPRQPLQEIGRYIAAADVQIVSLTDTPLLRVTMPGKVQAALAAGRPVLAHAAGDAASVITSNRVGVAADPTDPAAAAEAIRSMVSCTLGELAAMGAAARKVYDAEYSPAAVSSRLEEFLLGAIEKAPARRRRLK